MSNYEKYGSITISPTLINDKEEVHELHKQKGGGVTSWNDLTDKPFYEETVCLIEAQNVDVSNGKMFGYKAGTIETSVNLYEYVNENVTVVFDGTEYTCLVKADEYDDGYCHIGSVEIYKSSEGAPSSGIAESDKTGEPFDIHYKPSKTTLLCYGAGMHNIEVKANMPKTLDSKFLPKAEAVADVTEAPTAENFNALLASFRAAGYLGE